MTDVPRLVIKPGMRFTYMGDLKAPVPEHNPTMTVLATPTGWLVQTYHCDVAERLPIKLTSELQVPDKDHLINPCSFWPPAVWGDFDRGTPDQLGVQPHQLIAEWIFDMAEDQQPPHLILEGDDFTQLMAQRLTNRERPVTDASAMTLLDKLFDLLEESHDDGELPFHLATGVRPSRSECPAIFINERRIPAKKTKSREGFDTGRQFRIVIIEDFN